MIIKGVTNSICGSHKWYPHLVFSPTLILSVLKNPLIFVVYKAIYLLQTLELSAMSISVDVAITYCKVNSFPHTLFDRLNQFGIIIKLIRNTKRRSHKQVPQMKFMLSLLNQNKSYMSYID
jgi:hypothetical protein